MKWFLTGSMAIVGLLLSLAPVQAQCFTHGYCAPLGFRAHYRSSFYAAPIYAPVQTFVTQPVVQQVVQPVQQQVIQQEVYQQPICVQPFVTYPFVGFQGGYGYSHFRAGYGFNRVVVPHHHGHARGAIRR